MNILERKFTDKYIEDFSEENCKGVILEVKFNNSYHKGYIIGFLKNHMIVKFETKNQIWKVNMNSNVYNVLLGKKHLHVKESKLKAIKKQLKNKNIIKNVNKIAINKPIQKHKPNILNVHFLSYSV